MSEEAAKRLFERHFIGAAFEDALFHTDNNLREIACAWKIMSSVLHFGPLANGSWRWRAVGIPLNLLDPSLQGDIDLLGSEGATVRKRTLAYCTQCCGWA